MKSLSFDEIENIKKEAIQHAQYHYEAVVGLSKYFRGSEYEPISFQEYYEEVLIETSFTRGWDAAQKLFEEQKLLQEQQQKVSFSQRFLKYFRFA